MKNVITAMRRDSLLPVARLVKMVSEQEFQKKTFTQNDLHITAKIGLVKIPEISHQIVLAIGSENIVTYSAIKNAMINYGLSLGTTSSYVAKFPLQQVAKDLNAFDKKISEPDGGDVLVEQKVWIIGRREDFHYANNGAGALVYQLNYTANPKFFAIISHWGDVKKASWLTRFWRKMTYKELYYDRRRWV